MPHFAQAVVPLLQKTCLRHRSLHSTFDSSCCALVTKKIFLLCCVQWKGARILYLKLAQDPKSIAEFAEQLERESCISKIIHMLGHPCKDPISINVFAVDISASKSVHSSRPASMLEPVLEAQMTGLLLSMILQLALADSIPLIQHIYEAEGLLLLHVLAMDPFQHAHPETTARSIKLLRHDVYAKLAQLYR